MPYRKVPLVAGEIYHVFNRSITGVPIFPTSQYFTRFIELINYYRFKDTPVSYSQFKRIERDIRQQIMDDLIKEDDRQVEIFAFCLMDNHFLLKQTADNGIARFISNLQNGYAKYFNVRTERNGPLFQPMFKNTRIITDEQFLHVSRYIHLNPSTSYLVKIEDLENYKWSSLPGYLSLNQQYAFVNMSFILDLLSKKKYKQFVYDQAEYQRELGNIKHLLME